MQQDSWIMLNSKELSHSSLLHGLHSEKPLFAINNRAFSYNKHLTIDLWQHSGLAWLTDNGVIVNTAIRLVQKT